MFCGTVDPGIENRGVRASMEFSPVFRLQIGRLGNRLTEGFDFDTVTDESPQS